VYKVYGSCIKEILLSVDIERLVGTSQLFYSNLNTTILRDHLGEKDCDDATSEHFH
jgi:hypothetical protein